MTRDPAPLRPDSPGQGLALVGYRGTGKSTVGRLLAERSQRTFLDADVELEARAGVPVSTIFDRRGEPVFRDLEEQTLAELIRCYPGAIVATGGGVVLREANRRRLRDFGFVVWLRAEPVELACRLERDPRGLAARPALTADGTIAEIARVLEVRAPLYEGVADAVIETDGKGPDLVAAAILERWMPLAVTTALISPLYDRCLAMFVSWPILAILGLGFFLIGTVVGSFLNVCIYRIPWQKSVIWPSSRCPRCFGAIGAQDNVPIISWIALRGECRGCGLPISVRYPLVEALTGLLFLGAYMSDVVAGPRGAWGQVFAFQLVAAAYHAVFLALLVAATFIDYDLTIIPDQITVTGMIVGVVMGALVGPEVRPEPASWPRMTHGQGFWVGVAGLLVGMGLTQLIRKSAGAAFRREAMGFGDVTLMGMIGAFMGWRAAVLTFFLGPFFGLGHASWSLLRFLKKWITGGQLSTADRELPYGPYLSMAAATLFFLWPWIWLGWARGLFDTIYVLFWWMLGIHLNMPN